MAAPRTEPIVYASTPIFGGVSRYKVHWFHKQACAALRIEDLTVHDARHSLAVRWRKHGVVLEVIAAQLGHRTVLQGAQIYGRFQPTMDARQAEPRF